MQFGKMMLSARLIPNLVPGVTSMRKYSANSKTTISSAASELLPASLFQSPPLLSPGSDRAGSSDVLTIPSLAWPSVLSTRVLCRATQL